MEAKIIHNKAYNVTIKKAFFLSRARASQVVADQAPCSERHFTSFGLPLLVSATHTHDSGRAGGASKTQNLG